MVDRDEIDFDTLNYRAWTLDQRSHSKPASCILPTPRVRNA